MMNPHKAECLGYYSYGNGYFAPEARARAFGPDGASFCTARCHIAKACWEQTKERVNKEHPETQAYFDQLDVESALTKRSQGEIAAERAAKGEPDPYVKDMMQNMQRGLDDRYKKK